jgi:hypothetical protein
MSTARAKVAIVGGDPVVGDALEVLLQAAGYRTRFLPESVIGELGELLADSQLLVVAPVLSAECRKALVEMKLSQTMPLNVPVLELLPANGGHRLPVGDSLLWPCSGQELKDAIAALLLDQGRSGRM